MDPFPFDTWFICISFHQYSVLLCHAFESPKFPVSQLPNLWKHLPTIIFSKIIFSFCSKSSTFPSTFTLGTMALAPNSTKLAQSNYLLQPWDHIPHSWFCSEQFDLFRSNANLRTASRKVVREAAFTTCSQNFCQGCTTKNIVFPWQADIQPGLNMNSRLK